MKNSDLLDLAESNVKEKNYSREKKKGITGKKGKLIFSIVLFCVFVAVSAYSWMQIRQMNKPPDISKEELFENMNGYLFITISKLNAFNEVSGRLPVDEDEFLGWDDPAIEYTVSGDIFTLSVIYADTVITFKSGDDPSELLTEETLSRMGVTTN